MTALTEAAKEIAAASDERRLGPKDCARCPDCMAILRGNVDGYGRLTLDFVKRADAKDEQ